MTGDSYELALSLVHNDMDLLEDVHETIMENGISDDTYAKVFSLMFNSNRSDENRITFSSVEKEWKKNDRTLSDIKLFTALNQSCELVRAYVLASWENCVFSAWVSKKEVQKAEERMDSMESMAHAKTILALAAEMMSSEALGSTKIDWAAEDDDGDDPPGD